MSHTTLPFHAVTGIQALGWRKARRDETGPQPIWPILGGSEDADSDDKDGETADDEDAADDQGDDSSADDNAGDAETDWEAKAKELQAKFESQQRINRTLERRTKRDKATIDKLSGATSAAAATEDKSSGGKDDKPSQAVDVDKIRAEAAAQAKAEAAAEALKERVLDKIEAKAKNFADPADAVAMIMRGREADEFIDDGKIDVDAIQDALTELLEKKPYLGAAAQGGKNRFQGSAEGGAKPHRPQRPQSLHEAVNRRYNASS